MDFNNYQTEALLTDRVPARDGVDDATSLIVPMLGLAGETGQLLSEYKKHLRDGEAHKLFKERVSEELGDLLWYIAIAATERDRGDGRDRCSHLPIPARISKKYIAYFARTSDSCTNPAHRQHTWPQVMDEFLSHRSSGNHSHARRCHGYYRKGPVLAFILAAINK